MEAACKGKAIKALGCNRSFVPHTRPPMAEVCTAYSELKDVSHVGVAKGRGWGGTMREHPSNLPHVLSFMCVRAAPASPSQ